MCWGESPKSDASALRTLSWRTGLPERLALPLTSFVKRLVLDILHRTGIPSVGTAGHRQCQTRSRTTKNEIPHRDMTRSSSQHPVVP